ncbi:MAG: hypothetical protein MSS60_09840 [Clostridiales bacterium]|nr:hypothetical protein [Clostridiales bacterium]
MTQFTNSPYEKMMTQKPSGGGIPRRVPSLPKDHPCYGCSRVGQTCVGICHREMLALLNGRRKSK